MRLLICVISAEVAAISFILYDQNVFVWSNWQFLSEENRINNLQKNAANELTIVDIDDKEDVKSFTNAELLQSRHFLTRQIFHPYLGYSMRPGWTMKGMVAPSKTSVNYHGFPNWMLNDIKETDFVVLILGGSVAGGFDWHKRAKLKEKLQKLLPKRNIKIIPAINGGYKQPHQLFVLNYLILNGISPNIVLNIDGFNEAYMGWMNWKYFKADVMNPYVDFTYQIQGNIASSKAARISILKAQNKVVKIQRRILSSVFALEYCYYKYFIFPSATQALQDAKNRVSIGFNKANSQYLIIPNTNSDIKMVQKRIVEIWIKSSILISKILKNTNTLYIHMLQPNQYYGNRVFSKEEAKVAFTKQEPYGRFRNEIVGPVYSQMIRKSDRLRKSGIIFINGTNLFDDEKRSVYSDSCCHILPLGNEIILNKIFSTIKSHLTEAPTKIIEK